MSLTAALGAASVGSKIFSAIKGGQANQANEQLLREQRESDEAFYNNNRNFMETNLAKGILEKARDRYEENAKTSDSKAEVTGASAEQRVAEKTENNEGYNDVVRNLATSGTRYTQGNDMTYRNNLNRLLDTRMQLNQQKAESASNASGNAGDLLSSASMLEGFGGTQEGSTGAETGIGKVDDYRGVNLQK